MDDVIFRLWPYIERAGSVAAIILSAWLIWALRELQREKAAHQATLAMFHAAQERRIEDGLTALPIIKENTMVTREVGVFLHGLLNRGRR